MCLSESDEILVDCQRKLLKGIAFFVGVCGLCVCVCSVCLCLGGFPCWTPGTKHLGPFAVLQILITTNLTQAFVLCRSISILLYLCWIMKACNPIQTIWSIYSCEFCMLHNKKALTQSQLFIPGGWPHKVPIHYMKPWSKLMWFFFFGLWGWLPYNQCFFIQPPGIKSCDLNICESASTYKTTNMGGGGVGWAVGGVT